MTSLVNSVNFKGQTILEENKQENNALIGCFFSCGSTSGKCLC
ncbi:hypothetical protein ALTERO38_50196 [Alteromonas sp. 38]|nr:hypothetical protein ALTER154_90039 [Alteromonas sp. 154]VXB24090.1 hypothetical protein ALTERO38_50196 [Alteromonas sp. 38]